MAPPQVGVTAGRSAVEAAVRSDIDQLPDLIPVDHRGAHGSYIFDDRALHDEPTVRAEQSVQPLDIFDGTTRWPQTSRPQRWSHPPPPHIAANTATTAPGRPPAACGQALWLRSSGFLQHARPRLPPGAVMLRGYSSAFS